MKNEIRKFLEKYDACKDARQWIEENKITTLSDAWNKCQRVDWMLWALDKNGYCNKRTLRLFACWSTRNTPLADGRKTFDLLTDERSKRVIEVAEMYAEGKATNEELESAAWSAAWSKVSSMVSTSR